MKKTKNLSLFATIILVTTSCGAPRIKNLSAYQKQFLNKSEFMPSKEALENKPPKIVVFAFDENSNEVATQASLGDTIANNVENVLSSNRLAELVDRKANTKLQKEIALAESNKTGSYKGPKVADYAISGAISNASFTNKYSSGSTYINPKNGQVISIPPQYKYSSEVAGNIKIYEMPSLTVVDSVQFKGFKSRTENVRQDGGVSLGGIQIGGSQTDGISRDDGLVRGAAEDAIKTAEIDLKNALAKKGYILEKRSLDKKIIFKISLGSEDGVRHGDKFEIIGQYETQNSITEESEIEKRIIATGVISDQIDPKSSWIIIDNKENEGAIRLGDIVKMKYKRGLLDKVIIATKPLM